MVAAYLAAAKALSTFRPPQHFITTRCYSLGVSRLNKPLDGSALVPSPDCQVHSMAGTPGKSWTDHISLWGAERPLSEQAVKKNCSTRASSFCAGAYCTREHRGAKAASVLHNWHYRRSRSTAPVLKRISTMELLTPGTLVLCRHTAQAPSAGRELL